MRGARCRSLTRSAHAESRLHLLEPNQNFQSEHADSCMAASMRVNGCDWLRCVHARSHGSFCISDEQYSGTALSYYLGDAIASEVTGHLAMAQATSGGGFEEDEVISELLIQLRGSRKNLTLLPHFEDHHGECHAVERCACMHCPLAVACYLKFSYFHIGGYETASCFSCALRRLNMTIAQIDNGWDVHQACEALAARGGQDEPTTLFPCVPTVCQEIQGAHSREGPGTA